MRNHNPKLYRELSEPFESSGEAESTWKSFFEELGELRKKHGLPDVHVLVLGSYLADGEESQFMLDGHYGDPQRALMMAAWSLGVEQESHKNRVALLTAGPKNK